MALGQVEPGDFIYLDPPYEPLSKSSSFTAYSAGGFNRSEQERLAKAIETLNDKGCFFLLSNSATDYIKNLYRKYRIEEVKALRKINSKTERRGPISELSISNY